MSLAGGGDVEAQTLKQLKENLKNVLRKSGALNSIKAQIRRELVVGLSDKVATKLSRGCVSIDLKELLSLSIIYHFLQNRNYNHSLSVFAAECGLDSKSSWLSEIDIVKSLQFGTKSEVYRVISEKIKKNAGDSPVLPGSDISVFDILLSNISSESTMESPVAISAQTKEATVIHGPRESLEQRMQELHSTYLSRRDADRSAPGKSIEERMIHFQRECEERYQRDSESYINYMRETDMTKIRLEEAQKARKEIDILRKEIEADYQRKLQEHAERESASIRALSDRERLMQQSQYEARQLMQREIDDLRGREKSVQRKLEVESEGLRCLELRLNETRAMLQCKEREVERREKFAEDLFNDNLEKAKAEARAHLRSELEDLHRERTIVKQEKQHLHDVKSSQQTLLDSASNTRLMLRDAQSALILREDEVSAFKMKMDAINEKLSKYPAGWEHSYTFDASKVCMCMYVCVLIYVCICMCMYILLRSQLNARITFSLLAQNKLSEQRK